MKRSWEAVSRVTVCCAFTTGSLIKTERKNLSSASALYRFSYKKNILFQMKCLSSGPSGALGPRGLFAALSTALRVPGPDCSGGFSIFSVLFLLPSRHSAFLF